MKRKLFIALCAMFCLSVNPHNSRTYTSETLSFDDYWKGDNWNFGIAFRHRF